MSERDLPPGPGPDKYASCPHDGRILDYYRGAFDSVYILLHPFVRPPSGEPEWIWPRRRSKQEKMDGCEAISWEQILHMTCLKNLSEIDVGLKTLDWAVRPEYANKAFADAIANLEEDGIFPPSNGDLSLLLENRLIESIKALGYDRLWVSDEFCTVKRLHLVGELIEEEKIHSHGCLYPHDHRLLVTTHWDSHYSLLCSSRETIEKILAFDRFEGFYCSERTHVFWGLFGI